MGSLRAACATRCYWLHLLGCSLLALSTLGFQREALAVAPPKAAPAADSVSCTVRTIHGVASRGGIDKRLAFLRKQLSKAPFSSYKSIRLLGVKNLVIGQGAKQGMRLPNARTLTLSFKEKLLLKGRVRLRMHLAIAEPKTRRFSTRTLFSIADRGTLLVAGASYKKGTLIVGVTCREK